MAVRIINPVIAPNRAMSAQIIVRRRPVSRPHFLLCYDVIQDLFLGFFDRSPRIGINHRRLEFGLLLEVRLVPCDTRVGRFPQRIVGPHFGKDFCVGKLALFDESYDLGSNARHNGPDFFHDSS